MPVEVMTWCKFKEQTLLLLLVRLDMGLQFAVHSFCLLNAERILAVNRAVGGNTGFSTEITLRRTMQDQGCKKLGDVTRARLCARLVKKFKFNLLVLVCMRFVRTNGAGENWMTIACYQQFYHLVFLCLSHR